MAKARYAIVRDGKVWSVTGWDAEASPNWTPPFGEAVQCGATTAAGDIYDGQTFTKPSPSSAPPPEVISDRQFFHALAIEDYITEDEALAAVKTGAIPATLEAVIDAIPVARDRFAAKMHLSGSVEFRYSHPLVAQLGAALGWSEAQRAALWRLAGSLD